ncbi:MAG: XisI protein [Chloroflexi bacterium]|nr:XisI protein [Chloroflexota bacterium]MCC6894287.1 XisI protein [Anaerolineae bacterium]
MAQLMTEKLSLGEITRREVEKYVGHTHGAVMYSLFDDKQQRYGVVIIPEADSERPAYVAVMARIVGSYIVIDEDGTLDKPLYQALMVNAGIPRDQIVLAYKGEKLPHIH